MPTVCWKTRPESIANVFSMKNSSMLMISVSDNSLFGDFVDPINPIELENKGYHKYR
jgi:hypothetical protein